MERFINVIRNMLRMKAILKQQRKPTFEEVWKQIEAVRSDPKAMKLLDELIKAHTS